MSKKKTYLDDRCWRCGDKEAVNVATDTALLCKRCRRAVYGIPLVNDGPVFPFGGGAMQHGIYWDGHALDRCFKCTSNHVDPDDKLGLCETCKQEMKA